MSAGRIAYAESLFGNGITEGLGFAIVAYQGAPSTAGPGDTNAGLVVEVEGPLLHACEDVDAAAVPEHDSSRSKNKKQVQYYQKEEERLALLAQTEAALHHTLSLLRETDPGNTCPVVAAALRQFIAVDLEQEREQDEEGQDHRDEDEQAALQELLLDEPLNLLHVPAEQEKEVIRGIEEAPSSDEEIDENGNNLGEVGAALQQTIGGTVRMGGAAASALAAMLADQERELASGEVMKSNKRRKWAAAAEGAKDGESDVDEWERYKRLKKGAGDADARGGERLSRARGSKKDRKQASASSTGRKTNVRSRAKIQRTPPAEDHDEHVDGSTSKAPAVVPAASSSAPKQGAPVAASSCRRDPPVLTKAGTFKNCLKNVEVDPTKNDWVRWRNYIVVPAVASSCTTSTARVVNKNAKNAVDAGVVPEDTTTDEKEVLDAEGPAQARADQDEGEGEEPSFAELQKLDYLPFSLDDYFD
mmetsp:Transcript_18890/g.47201  ORF Transcript_18890/g.47201 Transcript_18890/m.47201 type:complete len:474 (+) Transcript_18890:546-1967(+)|eukprot:g6097.t1